MPYLLSSASLDWALENVSKFWDTDIFPRPFEFDAIGHEWPTIRDHLTNQDLETWRARQQRVCLSPKGLYSYRIATQLDPLDSLIYLALLYEGGNLIEAARVPRQVSTALSHRFEPDASGQLYAPGGWSDFQRRCAELAAGDGVQFIVEADISDFYHRLYHHRLENAVAATGATDHARLFNKLLSQWAGTPSYGIPVGPAPSRLLAEIAIDDVDRYLLATGAKFTRYVDDYRIFCGTRAEAYDRLSTLADTLFQNHGLTLQPGKTAIRTLAAFQDSLTAFESAELANLKQKYGQLLDVIGLGTYDQIEYEELDPKAQAAVDELNLEDLLREQMAGQVDPGLTRFIFRRLTQLDDSDVALEVVDNMEQLYAVLPEVVRYLSGLTDARLSVASRQRVGASVCALVMSSTIAHLSFHRAWLLSLFAESASWGQADQFIRLYDSSTDAFARREVILAIGKAKLAFWLRAKRNSLMAMDPWERRAFLLAASCWPKDERDHWYRSVRPHLDALECAVVDYARANPL